MRYVWWGGVRLGAGKGVFLCSAGSAIQEIHHNHRASRQQQWPRRKVRTPDCAPHPPPLSFLFALSALLQNVIPQAAEASITLRGATSPVFPPRAHYREAGVQRTEAKQGGERGAAREG